MRFLSTIALLLAIVALCVGALELAARTLLFERISPPFRLEAGDERALAYEYHPTLGWFPQKNLDVVHHASVPFRIQHNEHGFRDTVFEPAGERTSVLIVGDSFVWGFDVEAGQRFTNLLQQKLPQTKIYNIGVSGYGTTQQFLLLQEVFDRFNPEIVFLLFTGNDRYDNSANLGYSSYFRPYFVTVGDDIQLRGVPVPRSPIYQVKDWKVFRYSYLFRLAADVYTTHFFAAIHNVDDPTEAVMHKLSQFVAERGAQFTVGFVDRDQPLMTALQTASVPILDLASVGSTYRFNDNGEHWTAEGHQLVAELVDGFLRGRLAAIAVQ